MSMSARADATGGAGELDRLVGGPHEHAVQLYESEEELTGVVADFLERGLAAGEPVLVVARQERCAAVRSRLLAGGYDVDGAIGDGRVTLLDARETLRRITIDGSPDAELFDEVVGGMLTSISKK